jgi:hypothetical protein
VHQTTGLCKADKYRRNNVYVQAYRAPEVFDGNRKLPEPDISAVLTAGTLEFPFAFRVRDDAPGSCELPAGNYAYIRYTLYAHIDIAWLKDPSVKRVITVLPSRPLPPPARLRALGYAYPEPVKLHAYCCCPCFSVGSIGFEAVLLRQAFAPGEMLEYCVRVNNTTNSTLSLEINLLCTILLRTTGASDLSYKRHIRHAIFTDDIEPQGIYESSSIGSTSKLSVPLVFPTFNGGSGYVPVTSKNKEPLTFAYSVVFTVFPPGMCASTISVTIPV